MIATLAIDTLFVIAAALSVAAAGLLVRLRRMRRQPTDAEALDNTGRRILYMALATMPLSIACGAVKIMLTEHVSPWAFWVWLAGVTIEALILIGLDLRPAHN